MKVTVKLFAGLRPHLPGGAKAGPAVLEMNPGALVSDALADLEVPLEEAKIILLNSRHAKPDSELGEGDVLAVFPPVGGG